MSSGCRTITNMRFAAEADRLVGEEEKLANLVALLDKAFTKQHRGQCSENQADATQHQCSKIQRSK